MKRVSQNHNLGSGDLRRILTEILRDHGFAINFLLTQWIGHTFAQFTGNQNDLSIGDYRLGLFSSDASRDLTGLTPGLEGRVFPWVNTGAQDIVLKHQSAGSAAANRIICRSGADTTYGGGATSILWYDYGAQRWRSFIALLLCMKLFAVAGLVANL